MVEGESLGFGFLEKGGDWGGHRVTGEFERPKKVWDSGGWTGGGWGQKKGKKQRRLGIREGSWGRAGQRRTVGEKNAAWLQVCQNFERGEVSGKQSGGLGGRLVPTGFEGGVGDGNPAWGSVPGTPARGGGAECLEGWGIFGPCSHGETAKKDDRARVVRRPVGLNKKKGDRARLGREADSMKPVGGKIFAGRQPQGGNAVGGVVRCS